MLPLYNYEKCCIRFFNMKVKNCSQNLFFQSFSLLISAYYSVWFPYLLTLPYRDTCNAF